MKTVEHVYSIEGQYWQEGVIEDKSYSDTLVLYGGEAQTIKGFGACFNELGWDALQLLPEKQRQEIFDDFFGESCNFRICRLPIGANDFSRDWYSYDEEPDDYELKHFSITRDEETVLPYVREAMKRQPDLELFASPWSPPTWMKTKHAYNFGVLQDKPEIQKAYAAYLVKYVQAYAEAGVKIQQVHVQNEPFADQKFPSCKWTGSQMRDFIRDYLGPAFAKSGLDTELWLGTINGPFSDFMLQGCSSPFSEFYDQFVHTILADKKTRSYLKGVGFQWGGKHSIEQTELSYPELRFMQTEVECGDGKNTWEHAEYVFGLFWQYFQHQAESCVYWNMALCEGGISTWAWEQNSLLTVNEESRTFVYQPEYYLLKHFSHFIQPGAKRLRTLGHWTANSLVFRNPDNSIIVIADNAMHEGQGFTMQLPGQRLSAWIPAHSIHTFCVK